MQSYLYRVALAGVLLVAGSNFRLGFAAPAASAQASQRDIVFILTDDQPFHTLQFMPLTNQLIGDAGVRFTNAYNSTPLCCPSRAASMTGRYGHNTNILGNVMPWGSAALFQANGSDQSTIATWLDTAGYQTYFVGKYLNEYNEIAPYQPPGWDEWHALVKIGSEGGYQNWYMLENGVEHHYDAPGSANYSVNVMRDMAVELIRSTPAGTPLFLYFAPTAPHQPATPDPIDVGSFSNLPPHRPPSYDEADVSDKPRWVRELPPVSTQQQAAMDALYRNQIESLQSVDRAVEAIVLALQETGRLDNTAIVFTSDNGYSLGEHRWERKECVYLECTQMPLLVRAPGVTPRVDDNLILNIDLPVTFAEWAGVTPPAGLDGVSFASLLLDPAQPWRDHALLEVLGRPHNHHMNFQGLVTRQYLYAEYANGDRELYDLSLDPYQLTNVYTHPEYGLAAADLHAKLLAFKVPADLQVFSSASSASPAPGSPLTYTLSLNNLGPSHSASVYLTATIPSQLQVLSCASTLGGLCGAYGNQRVVKFISLAANTEAVITVVARVKDYVAPGAQIAFHAFASGFSSVDDNPPNNSTLHLSVVTLPTSVTATQTETPTATPLPTDTPVPATSETPAGTAAPSESPTALPSPTENSTPTPTSTPPATDTHTPTVSPTASATATAAPTESPTTLSLPTETSTPTHSPTHTPTASPTALPDTQVPVVAITAPRHNTNVIGNTLVVIRANASDNVGIARVEFFVNQVLTCTAVSAPYTCAWIVPGGLPGDYVLRAKGIDLAGNIKNAQITVRQR